MHAGQDVEPELAAARYKADLFSRAFGLRVDVVAAPPDAPEEEGGDSSAAATAAASISG